MASYEHANALMRAHGEAGRPGRPVSLTMDGLIYTTSIVMPGSARRKAPANVADGPGNGLTSATVAARPAVALAGSYELLMMIIRSADGPPDQSAQPSARRTTCGR